MLNVVKKISKDIKLLYEQEVINTLEHLAVKEIVDTIEEDYIIMLNSVSAHKNSLTRPILYQDIFMDRLNNFTFLEILNSNIILNVPDMETFNFSGELRVIQTILEGLFPSVYFEIKESDRKRMGLVKSTIRFIIKGETLYLYDIKKYNNLETLMQNNKVEKIEYPFSKVGPLDIFTNADDVVNEYMDKWLTTAIKEGQLKFTKKYNKKSL